MELESIKYKTDTKPLAHGGSNFETHVLIKKSNTRIEIKPTLGMAIFTAVFTIFSVVFAGVPIYKLINNNTSEWDFNTVLFSAFGLIFFCASLYLLLHYFMPHYFDKVARHYYRGFKNISTKLSVSLDFNTIIAIQIIGETVNDDNSNFKSFELNLVLNDASRINVIDHSNLKGIIDDATSLSQFLDVPIWHAESNKT